jgi:hypothetical protein
MKDTKTASPAERPTTTDPSLDQFRKLLDVLDPPSEVEVSDRFGETHRLAASVSARQQIRILREFERVKELPIASEVASLDLGGGAVAGALVALASDPEVLSSLASAFETAHPAAVRAARNSATESEIEVEDAADLFAIEELVAGLVPLFGRLVHRSASAMRALDGASPTTSPT